MTGRDMTGPGRPPVRPVVEIGVIGPLRVVRSGRTVTPTPPKLRQLLALLAVSANEVVRIETITDELWTAPPTERMCSTVQTYVSQLRKLVAAPPVTPGTPPVTIVHTPRVGYRMTTAAGAGLDLFRLRRLAGAAAQGDARTAVAPLRAAVELCRGPVLSDVRLGPVLTEHRNRLDADRIGVLDRYLRTQLELGDPGAVIHQTARIEAEDSRHEELYANLVLALAGVGRRAEAVELFHRVRGRQVERSGIEPGPMLRGAFQQAISSDPARTAPGPASTPPAQLPVDPNPFVGRERELAAAAAALVAPRTERPAVLAVVGGPGSGRSAFCAQVAERASADHPDGQLYTDLADGPAEALAGFLRALGSTDVPAGLHERIRAFRARTEGLRILVLADNVTGPDVVAALVPGSPSGALVLASAIRPAADRRSVVLELPRLSPDEQTALFARRLGPERVAAEPGAVAAVVRRCGGLPLAVNAAIARALMRPHWSLARLAASGPAFSVAGFDLSASVQRGLDLLDATEQAGLRALVPAASAGPLPVRRAAAVLGTDVEHAEHLLERLVEVRLADPVGHGRVQPVAEYRYRVDPVYCEVLAASSSSTASAAAAGPPADASAPATDPAAAA